MFFKKKKIKKKKTTETDVAIFNLRNCIIKLYNCDLARDQKALKRFKNGQQTKDDEDIYGNVGCVIDNIEATQIIIDKIKKMNLSEILGHLFVSKDRIDESVINNNKTLFLRTLSLFGDNFNLLRKQFKGKEKFYITQAKMMCHKDNDLDDETRSDKFKELKGKFAKLLAEIEEKENTQFSPN
ncbi:MAG: hypothetical protein PVI75_07700 [Gammaproteobacteria bacterium]